MTNPSGDPRLDPEFQRKHGVRQTGALKAPKGKALPKHSYTILATPLNEPLTFTTAALSRYLVVGISGRRLWLIRRSNDYEQIRDFMVVFSQISEWQWRRVIDQRTGEILEYKEGAEDLTRVEEET